MINFEKSQKFQEAKDSLPQELHEVHKQLVEEYAFHTETKYGRGYVAYAVLAELIRDGWRPSGEPIKDE